MSYAAAFRGEVLRNFPLIGITIVAALRSIGENLIPTFLPLYLATELGFGTATIGLYLACLAFVGTVFAPVIGHASDRWGRKPTIFLALLAGGLLIGAVPLFPSGIVLLPVVSLGGMSLFDSLCHSFAVGYPDVLDLSRGAQIQAAFTACRIEPVTDAGDCPEALEVPR